MSARDDDHDLRTTWKEQDMSSPSFTTDDLRQRAGRLGSRVRRRNLVEYLAAAAVAGFFLALALGLLGGPEPGPGTLVERLGAGLIALGAVFVALQLRRRTDIRPDAALPGLRHYIAELERQRDALRSAWAWYVLPVVPGMALLVAGIAMQPGASLVVLGLVAAVMALVLAAIAWLNRAAASAIDAEIAALRPQMGA